MAGFTATTLAVMAIAGTAAAVAGQVMQGQAQAAQGRQMAKAAEMNALNDRQQAKMIDQSSAYQTEMAREEQRRMVGRQRALYAKAGVRFSGSPLDVISDSITNSEMDIAANHNANIMKSRAMSSATQNDFLASTYRDAGAVAGNEGMFKAGSTLLSSGANIGNQYFGAFKYKTPTKVSTSGVK